MYIPLTVFVCLQAALEQNRQGRRGGGGGGEGGDWDGFTFQSMTIKHSNVHSRLATLWLYGQTYVRLTVILAMVRICMRRL